MLLSFLQGQALEVKSIWDPLVHKTGSEVLRERESPPAGSVTSRVGFCCPMASRT